MKNKIEKAIAQVHSSMHVPIHLKSRELIGVKRMTEQIKSAIRTFNQLLFLGNHMMMSSQEVAITMKFHQVD